MRRDERGDPGRSTAGTALRREALAERPPFSDRFHGELVGRLPPGDRPGTARSVAGPAAMPATRRMAIPLAAWATLVVAAILAVTLPDRVRTGRDQTGRGQIPARSVGPMPAGEAGLPVRADFTGGQQPIAAAGQEDEPLGLDRLPMFDQIDEEVRAGLTTLAVSLLEVPDWRPLAGLATSAFPDADAPPAGQSGSWSPVTP